MEERKDRKPLDILIQVLAQDTESSKFGVPTTEACGLVHHIKDKCPFLKFKGLMSMGEIGNTKEFESIYELKV